MKKIVLGIIGGSEGNGHPFSWSAIINGYNKDVMEFSGYPIISEYLAEQQWPDAKIKGAAVNYIHTQNDDLSRLIARATFINNIISKPYEMLGHIDGLLLARDDAENHFRHAHKFLSAGIPIFIDKPIALNSVALKELWSLQQYENQIFSCSGLTHSLATKENQKLISSVGKISSITATTPNSWDRYGIHIIEPLINYFHGIKNVKVAQDISQNKGVVSLSFSNADNVNVKLISLGSGAKSEIQFVFCGEKGEVSIKPNNYFSYFKKSLQRFILNIFERRPIWECSLEHHKRVVDLIEMGKS